MIASLPERKCANRSQPLPSFIRARLHVDTVTQLETVEEVEQEIARLPKGTNDTYAAILDGILDRYPGERNRRILRNMFIWLCQAKYCLPVSEFVAVTTLDIDPSNWINKKTIPWDGEAFVHRLGPLLNIDRHRSPPEINLSHVSAEEYLEGPIAETNLKDLQVKSHEAQRFLAEFCIKFLGYCDFHTPLSTPEKVGNVNPFRCIPGGLGMALDPAKYKYEWIRPMQEQLRTSQGLEYTAINWWYHLKAAWRSGKPASWLRDEVVPHLGWFLDADDPQYRSWWEVHAYFCHEREEDCLCKEWQPPEYFVEKLKLGFLKPYLKGCGPAPEHCDEDDDDNDHNEDDDEGSCSTLPGPPRRCPECEIPTETAFDINLGDGATHGHRPLERHLRARKCARCRAPGVSPYPKRRRRGCIQSKRCFKYISHARV